MDQEYEKLEIEVIEFETDDIVVCSDPRYPGEEDPI